MRAVPSAEAAPGRPALIVLSLALSAVLTWAFVPARDAAVVVPVNGLRAIGGLACLLAVVVAAATALGPLRQRGRVRFISELLTLWRCPARPPRAGFVGSAIANLLLVTGSAVFVLGAWRDHGGAQVGLGVATGALLLLLVVLRLVDDPDPASTALDDYGHPAAAALFYLAAVALEWSVVGRLGPAGWWLGVVHLVTSQALILMAVAGSLLTYGVGGTLWPPIALRVLLDVQPGSYAGCVRGFQWPATCLAGAALCAGALGW